MAWVPTANDTPFHRLGGDEAVKRLAQSFYDHMDRDEPALAALHDRDEQGRVSARSRERFGRFLVEWLGGPTVYSSVEGHPRLRMRHGRVTVSVPMRDAWLRCMQRALDEHAVTGEVRVFLDARFAEVADFLRNTGD